MPPKRKSARNAPRSCTGSTRNTRASPLQDAITSLTSLFPITTPYPDPANDDTLIPAADVMLEQELLRNPDNFRSWSSYIDHILDTNIVKRPPPDVSLSTYQASLLGPLASSTQRIALRRVTSIYERALAQFPTRYSLWRDYLQNRSRLVLGEPKGGFEAKRKRDLQAAREKLDFGPTLIDSPDDEDFGRTYSGGLDGTVGWQEWKSLAALYERALMWLPTMPRLWLNYLSMFIHPQCPTDLSYTHARRTFDRALRTLPGSLHLRIWKVYLKWAERRGGETCLRVWRRYLRVDPTLTERYVSILLAQKEDQAEDAASKTTTKRTRSKQESHHGAHEKVDLQSSGSFEASAPAGSRRRGWVVCQSGKQESLPALHRMARADRKVSRRDRSGPRGREAVTTRAGRHFINNRRSGERQTNPHTSRKARQEEGRIKQRDLKGVVRQPGGDRASRSFPSQRDKDHQRRRTRPIRGPVGTTLDRSRNVLDQARRVRVGARYIRSRHEGRQDSPRLYSDLRRLRPKRART